MATVAMLKGKEVAGTGWSRGADAVSSVSRKCTPYSTPPCQAKRARVPSEESAKEPMTIAGSEKVEELKLR